MFNALPNKEEKAVFVIRHKGGNFINRSESYTLTFRLYQPSLQSQPLTQQTQEYTLKPEVALLTIFPIWKEKMRTSHLREDFSLIQTSNFTTGEETYRTVFSLAWEILSLSDFLVSLQYQEKEETYKPTSLSPSISIKFPRQKNLNFAGTVKHEVVEKHPKLLPAVLILPGSRIFDGNWSP